MSKKAKVVNHPLGGDEELGTETTNAVYGHFYNAEINLANVEMDQDLLDIMYHVDNSQAKFADDLKDFVRYRTVSKSLVDNEQDFYSLLKLSQAWLTRLGFSAKCYDVGFHDLSNQRMKLHLPPILLANTPKNTKLKTICVYSFLDVADADPSSWDTDPWTVTEKDKRLYGRGVAGGKGQLLMWFHAIESYIAANVELPVNIKFLIETMHECNSKGLETFLETRKQDFLLNLDYVIMCNSEWIGPDRPCLVFGGVGMVHFSITVEKTAGSETSPSEDMKTILGTIVDEEENIIIPKFYHSVADITADEEELYQSVEFDVEKVREKLPPYRKAWNKLKVLMHFWRMPSISIDQEALTEEEEEISKTLPVVKKNFVIKIVQKQMPEKISSMVHEHIKKTNKELLIKNKVTVVTKHFSRPWLQNYKKACYEAAKRANIQIYRLKPDMIREDKDNFQMNILQKLIDKPFLKFPLVNNQANPNGNNENITLKNYFEGTKVLAAFMMQLPAVLKKQKFVEE